MYFRWQSIFVLFSEDSSQEYLVFKSRLCENFYRGLFELWVSVTLRLGEQGWHITKGICITTVDSWWYMEIFAEMCEIVSNYCSLIHHLGIPLH